MFDQDYLYQVFAQYASPPRAKRRAPEPTRKWLCNGWTVAAHTRSEARAKFKRFLELKRLPVATVLTAVA